MGPVRKQDADFILNNNTWVSKKSTLTLGPYVQEWILTIKCLGHYKLQMKMEPFLLITTLTELGPHTNSIYNTDALASLVPISWLTYPPT